MNSENYCLNEIVDVAYELSEIIGEQAGQFSKRFCCSPIITNWSKKVYSRRYHYELEIIEDNAAEGHKYEYSHNEEAHYAAMNAAMLELTEYFGDESVGRILHFIFNINSEYIFDGCRDWELTRFSRYMMEYAPISSKGSLYKKIVKTFDEIKHRNANIIQRSDKVLKMRTANC